jgi:hypothetical protein
VLDSSQPGNASFRSVMMSYCSAETSRITLST